MTDYIKYAKGGKFPAKPQEISDNLDAFDDAGKLIEENEVVIDIDGISRQLIEKIIDYFRIDTEYWITNNGVHFHYIMPTESIQIAQKAICALGIEVEYKKVTGKNKSVRVKTDGKKLECHNEGELKPLPNFFKPYNRRKGFKHNFEGMTDGDGRNMKLFSHSASMPSGWSNKGKILDFINEHIFAEPLTSSEMESIKNAGSGNSAESDEIVIGRKISQDLSTTLYNGSVYYLKQGVYVRHEENTRNDLKVVIKDYMPLALTKTIEECFKQVKLFSHREDKNSNDKVLAFRNGILDKGEFLEVSGVFTPYFLDIEYKPKAEPVKVVDDYLDHISEGDPETRRFFLQIIGSILITDFDVKGSLKKHFVVKGLSDSGKGTFLKVIGGIFEGLASTVDPHEMNRTKQVSSMIDKLVNLSDDITDEVIGKVQTKVLKNMVSCDTDTAELLYQEGVSIRYTQTQITATNFEMRTAEKDENFEKKKVTIWLNKRPAKKNPRLLAELTTKEAKEYWISLAVPEYKRLFKNGEFDIPAKVQASSESASKENINILEWLDIYNIDRDMMKGTCVKWGYGLYEKWCYAVNGADQPRVLSSKTFQKVVCDKLGLSLGRTLFDDGYSRQNHFLEPIDAGKTKLSDLSEVYRPTHRTHIPHNMIDDLANVLPSESGDYTREVQYEKE